VTASLKNQDDVSLERSGSDMQYALDSPNYWKQLSGRVTIPYKNSPVFKLFH